MRKFSLKNVAFSLPALQPVATRLDEIEFTDCQLKDSARGFLTEGWTALTSLTLTGSRVTDDVLPPALNLPALQDISMDDFEYQGSRLQLSQLISSCPQVSGLRFEWLPSMAQSSEGSGQLVGLYRLGKLADLHITSCSHHDMLRCWDLPASLTSLRVDGSGLSGNKTVNLFWVVREAVHCISRGAQLRTLFSGNSEAFLQSGQWGVGLTEQYRLQGQQLSSLRELTVWGFREPLLRAVGALASSAPSLTRLEFGLQGLQLPMDLLPPLRSASLESITVHCYARGPMAPHPPVVLTFLPGCARLREVLVRFLDTPGEGTAVKIRCHCCSRRCIAPLDLFAGLNKGAPLHVHACSVKKVGVRFLPMPLSADGVQGYTIMYSCHAAGSESTPMWGHVVMPGCL